VVALVVIREAHHRRR